MEIQFPQAPIPAPTRIWDVYVPIATSKNVAHVYITEPIDDPSYYNELCHLLDTATSSDVVYLHINTPGGMLDSTFMLIDSIRKSQARIVASLSGTVASAGTMIALACKDLEVAEHTSFMIHNYSSGLKG